MSLTLTDLRLRLRIAGRNANDQNYYSNAALDEALDRLLARFLRVTRCVKTAFTVNFVTSGNTVDFSGLSAFLPGRIERMRIDTDTHYTKIYHDLTQTDSGAVLDKLACNTSTTSTYCGETLIGFTGSTTAKLYPAPGFDGTITGTYCPLQTPWTLGTMGAYAAGTTYYLNDVVSSSGTLYQSLINANVGNTPVSSPTQWLSLGAGTLIAPANITSVIDDGLLSELIGCGGPAILQSVDPEHQEFVGPAWASYLAFEDSCRGIGSISGNVSTPSMSSLRGGRW